MIRMDSITRSKIDIQNSPPKVSVIIPTYNRASFVIKAIESVLAQSFNDYEIIVIDDGSTDNTKEVLEPYRGRIQYIHQENSGVSAARNAGIRLAKGDWIAFLDSDDEWMRDYLAKQVRCMDENLGAVGYMTNSVTIRPSGKRENLFLGTGLLKEFGKHSALKVERPFGMVIKYSPWFPQATILNRDILIKIGMLNTGLTIAEDLDVVARMALKGPFVISRDVLVTVYNRQEDIKSLSRRAFENRINSYKSRENVLKNLSNMNLSFMEKIILSKALSSTTRSIANLLMKENNVKVARSCFKKAFFQYPSVKSFIKCITSLFSLFLLQSGSLRIVSRLKDMYEVFHNTVE